VRLNARSPPLTIFRHALVTDAVTFPSHSGSNGPQRLSLRPQGDHFPDQGTCHSGLTHSLRAVRQWGEPPIVLTVLIAALCRPDSSWASAKMQGGLKPVTSLTAATQPS
jgi:hypothetical protein